MYEQSRGKDDGVPDNANYMELIAPYVNKDKSSQK